MRLHCIHVYADILEFQVHVHVKPLSMTVSVKIYFQGIWHLSTSIQSFLPEILKMLSTKKCVTRVNIWRISTPEFIPTFLMLKNEKLQVFHAALSFKWTNLQMSSSFSVGKRLKVDIKDNYILFTNKLNKQRCIICMIERNIHKCLND